MKDALRQRALALGFDDCRITTAEPPDHAGRFEAWLSDGQHGDMAYLQRNAHKRVDPQKVLPGARSIVCLAASYHREETVNGRNGVSATDEHNAPLPSRPGNAAKAGQPRTTGLIARYARFADYHDVLGDRLQTLTAFLDGLGGPGTRSLWYVDTGPLLERDLAQRAGLGFVGKHTNVISRHLGNWVFLAEVLTTLELEPDAPEKNRCGTCTRCLAACPTGAITAPFELDARRCISYLTIELKGAIPVEFRPAIGNRIYGCDDCLEVCPWNRFAREGKLMRDHRRADLQAPDLIELLALDDAAFKRRFAGTPMLRTKRRGLLRNVCVALGNARDPRALPALEAAARDHEPLIAEHAHWAIERIEEAGETPAASTSS
jgi:epoxyqueuosine reductase